MQIGISLSSVISPMEKEFQLQIMSSVSYIICKVILNMNGKVVAVDENNATASSQLLLETGG